MRWGYDETTWNQAKAEVRQLLVRRALERRPITYGELTDQMSIKFRHWTAPISVLLDELSGDEDREGRGLLGALVVHRSGDRLPGPGFFYKTARRLGRVFDDTSAGKRTFWEHEVDRLYKEAAESKS